MRSRSCRSALSSSDSAIQRLQTFMSFVRHSLLITKILPHLTNGLIVIEYLVQALVELLNDSPLEESSLSWRQLRHSLGEHLAIYPELTSAIGLEISAPSAHFSDRVVHRPPAYRVGVDVALGPQRKLSASVGHTVRGLTSHDAPSRCGSVQWEACSLRTRCRKAYGASPPAVQAPKGDVMSPVFARLAV